MLNNLEFWVIGGSIHAIKSHDNTQQNVVMKERQLL